MPISHKSAGWALAAWTLLSLLVCGSWAQNPQVLLWPNGAPRATGSDSLSKPAITPFPAANPNGAAVVIFPGGGYEHLASVKEGSGPAQWLAKLGVTAFVVRYRLGMVYHHPVEMWDGQRAIRWVRANAAKYGIDTARVGVLGFSAGGHLAATVSTHYDEGNPAATDTVDRHGCRPAFSILGYPVITMNSSFTHKGSRDYLLGSNPSQLLVDSLSNEKWVTARTPPAFLFHSTDDNAVPIKNSQSYHDSLVKRGVTASLMKFDHGGHGFGMADGKSGSSNDPALNAWCDSSVKWLDKLGFFKPAAVSLGQHKRAQARGPMLRMEDRDGRDADALGRRPRTLRSSAKAPSAPTHAASEASR
ncbi:MAG: alpha/beta hydrolase [Fibrobacteria bacterium]